MGTTIFPGFDINLGLPSQSLRRQSWRTAQCCSTAGALQAADAPNAQWPECGRPPNAGSCRRLRHPLVVEPPDMPGEFVEKTSNTYG